MAIKPLNSVAGFSVGETPVSIILANGDVTTTNITTTGVSNLNSISNVKIPGGISGQVITTDGFGNLSYTTIDTATLSNGTSNIKIANNGNITISAAGNANVLTVTGLGANIEGTLGVTGNISAAGLKTNNLYYANGTPWDLQEAAGSNRQIQYNDGLNNFAASANFTYNSDNNLLTVVGNIDVLNASLGNLATANFINVSSNTTTANLTVNNSISGNTANFSGNVVAPNLTVNSSIEGNTANFSGNVVAPNLTVNLELAGNTANFSGNVEVLGLLTDNLYYANGDVWDLQQAAGANYEIQYNIDDNFAASANFTYNDTTQQLTVLGNAQFNNASLGNLATANYINVASNAIAGNLTVNNSISGNTANFSGNVVLPNLTVNLELQANTANFDGNVVMDNWLTVSNTANVGALRTDSLLYANGQPWDMLQAAGANYEIQYNIDDNFAASANLTYNDTTQQFTVLGNAQFNNANLGNLAIANYVNVASNTVTNNLTVNSEIAGNTANFSGNVVVPNLSVNLELAGNTANFTGNITAQNANLGNLATANYVNVSQQINGNVANFSGNLISQNANLGNLATANYVNVANDLDVVGNVNAGNIVGTFANGNSNVKIYGNSNVEVSVNGTANVATFTDTEFLVVGEIKTTAGNILSNGNVTANGFINGANANITGESILGSVVTANIVAPIGNITISATGTDQSITLTPTGTGVVDVSGKRIADLADPVNPTDAATKEYVDAMAGEGLDIHTPVRVEAPTALTATYVQGGTTPTVDSISGGNVIDFGSAHGLSVNDGIVFDNSFNGIVGGEAYWVYSVPNSTSITIKDGYYGAEITTLSNGTSLAEPSRANPGVGATLTNAGANAALQIDGITLSTNDRVLVYNQSNGYENGVYTVTTVGDGSTAWVLTRATDFDKYSPDTPNGLSAGSYVFVTQGLTGAGESHVMTAPVGEVIVGTDSLTFTQFSAAGSYTAGSGINITGTTISANVDNLTTAIVDGNIVVKANAQFTTPNIDAAIGTSLTLTGNASANNLSISNLANIGANLTVAGNIFADYAIVSNANVSGLNITTSGNVQATGNVDVTGNVIAANITANSTVFASNANVSGTTITNALTVNNAITGNTANFSGNIVVNNATVNLELAGNTANFTGNVTLANLVVNTELSGNTANFSGNVEVLGLLTDNLYYSNGSPWDLQQAAGANYEIQYNIDDNFAASANFTYNDTTQVLKVNGTANVTTANISGAVNLGNSTVNTALSWASVTTTSVTPNQTIASFNVSGVTGVEFLVKAIDENGTANKYSVATVIAVTDGTNVDYSTYGTVQLGGYTGSLAVGISGNTIRLQVTPSSSNSTVWTTQYRVI